MSHNEIIYSEQEEKEIEDFFVNVETAKNKILNDVVNSYKTNEMTLENILEVFHKNVSIFNVISDSTIRIYIESIFNKVENSNTNNSEVKYYVTDKALEDFLTSIYIFSEN